MNKEEIYRKILNNEELTQEEELFCMQEALKLDNQIAARGCSKCGGHNLKFSYFEGGPDRNKIHCLTCHHEVFNYV